MSMYKHRHPFFLFSFSSSYKHAKPKSPPNYVKYELLWIVVLSIDWSKVTIIIIIIITFSFSFQHLETTNIQLRRQRYGVVVRNCQSPSQVLKLLLEKGTLIWCRSTGTWPHIHRKKHRTKGGMEYSLEEHACGTKRLFVWQNIKSSGHIPPFFGCLMSDVVICDHL